MPWVPFFRRLAADDGSNACVEECTGERRLVHAPARGRSYSNACRWSLVELQAVEELGRRWG
jgi:hypothetical protein